MLQIFNFGQGFDVMLYEWQAGDVEKWFGYVHRQWPEPGTLGGTGK